MYQVEYMSINELVSSQHSYRQFLKVWDFKKIDTMINELYANNTYSGYGLPTLFRCLLLQFLEDLSDRELEAFLQENIAAKWFCNFRLVDKTPDHTVFTRARKRLGTSFLSKTFENLRNQLKEAGLMNEFFTFVDATHLIAKASLWEERDKLKAAKYEVMNNTTLPKVAVDKQARIGCKGKRKYWYGYKKHVSVDMRSGLINKVAITPANLTDAQGLKYVCPKQGAIYADKGYCVQPAKDIAAYNNCHLAAIKNNNMKEKNKEQDKFYSRMRSPYERVFSKTSKRVRYRGIAKNQFAAIMEAICFNLKRLLVISPPISITLG
jgi:IS5 family transposase